MYQRFQPPDYPTARLPNPQIIQPPDYPTARLPNRQIIQPPDYSPTNQIINQKTIQY